MLFYEAKCTRKSKTNNFENEILLFYYHNHARQIVNIDAFRLFLLTMLYKKRHEKFGFLLSLYSSFTYVLIRAENSFGKFVNLFIRFFLSTFMA